MYSNIRMSFILFDVEFIEKVIKFHRVPLCSFSILDVDSLEFAYQA